MHKNLDRSKVLVKKPSGTRRGHGFSSLEIKSAGLSKRHLYKKKLAFDKRRKSSHQQNIDFLKTIK